MIDINFFARKAAAAKQKTQDTAVDSWSGDRTQELPVLNGAKLHITYRGVVYPWQLDHMNHMNVQSYAAAFDQSSWVLLALLGLDSFYFQRHRRGMAALEQRIAYKSELRSGDTFEIRSKVLKVEEKTVRLQHDMHKVRNGELAASTTILGVHLDADARRGVPLPDGVSDRACLLNATALTDSMLPSGAEDRGLTCELR